MTAPKKKTVILVAESFAYGTAKSLKQLCDILQDDYRIIVYYSSRDGTDAELQDVNPNITWVQLSQARLVRHFVNIMKIRSAIDSQTYALHGHSSYGGLYARLAALGKGVPMVFYSPRAYAFLRKDLSWLARRLLFLTEAALANCGITVSCGPSEYHIGSRFSRRIVNINNAIAVTERRKTQTTDCCRVVAVGRICHQKGFDRFLETALILPDIEFVWFGGRQDTYYDRTVSAYGGLPGNVRIIEFLDQDALFNELSHATLLFHPSRWEGLSRVLLEALSLGMPIVTSTCPANLDCLTPRHPYDHPGQYDNGFACRTVADYVAAIGKLRDNPDLVARMSHASLLLARKEFNISQVRQRWLSLYSGELIT